MRKREGVSIHLAQIPTSPKDFANTSGIILWYDLSLGPTLISDDVFFKKNIKYNIPMSPFLVSYRSVSGSDRGPF